MLVSTLNFRSEKQHTNTFIKNAHFILDIHLKNVSPLRWTLAVPQNLTLIKQRNVFNKATS